MLTINSPATYIPERKYIINVLFGDFLGLEHRVLFHHKSDVEITGPDGEKLILADVFFQTSTDDWLTSKSLPMEPLKVWDTNSAFSEVPLVTAKVPVIFGKLGYESTQNSSIPLDILGSSFFMLTRYEELVTSTYDSYGRFPAKASLAFRNRFLERPIVNEYLEILWWALKKIWPGLLRKKRAFRLSATHDVDIPFEYLVMPFRKIALKMGAEILLRKNLPAAIKKITNWINVKTGRQQDPFNTFDWIMHQSEMVGIKSHFNIMSGGRTPMDFYYPIGSPPIQNLLTKIVDRGHELGFHPSYHTAINGSLWRKEFERLKACTRNFKIKGGRQHYLRFKAPITWRFWADNGMEYDSTLVFADHAGFRCGTCYDYPIFDLEKREPIKLRERPLIVMDRTVIDNDYMGFGYTQKSLDYILELKGRCRKYQGDFVFLWHNQRFVNHKERDIYQSIIRAN